MLGLAIGDAIRRAMLSSITGLGAADHQPRVGQLKLPPPELWTGITAMSLALADSLHAEGGLNEQDVLSRLIECRTAGSYSCTGAWVGFNDAVVQAYGGGPFSEAGHPAARSHHFSSLMRLAPLAVRYWNDRTALRDAAARQSKITSLEPEIIEACVAVAEATADAIAGIDQAETLARLGRWSTPASSVFDENLARQGCRGTTDTDLAYALSGVLGALEGPVTFETALLSAVRFDGMNVDALPLAGQLSGAIQGASRCPSEWRESVAWGARIEGMALALLRQSGLRI